ncbi:MAG: bifunctional diaminohydroxyphosphoribosylaminopyrimidine deaminase/5-amino-6-(5-phosphoribosylamino)uracil reductase RibD [Legionella sp.]|nr:bifunctional diaminohydroxyphosphoribosylaminopyrimidine deaminase/5-amino-6-(5-phosphoribosylamino)uracil reductase RibD [Legionella sp.]
MHKQFMKAALQQAYRGRGACAPNPSVGAVAVHNNKIIAEAFHQGAGSAHAEQCILEQIKGNTRDVTLYVTLEPCNHWGKTPPCVSAIIEAGVTRVVYGFRDPNPLVIANNTPLILKKQGIDVIHFPLTEIDEFYKSYQFWTATRKPWITAKIAQTLDGKIAGVNGEKVVLSNQHCALFTHMQRSYADVIVTSARTIINDDPAMTARLDNLTIKKPVAILDARLSLPLRRKIFHEASHCHIFHDANIKVTEAHNNCSYYGVPAVNGHLDLSAVIKHLGAMGFHDAWVEVGGTIFSALHEQELVQRTYLYIVPQTLGINATPAYPGKNLFGREHTISWQIQKNNIIACLDWQESSCLPA